MSAHNLAEIPPILLPTPWPISEGQKRSGGFSPASNGFYISRQRDLFQRQPERRDGMSDAVETLVAYCRENNRVCPLPPLWSVGRTLGDAAQPHAGRSWMAASTTLILAAWHDAPAMLKMLRLAEHIEWAAQHGALEFGRPFSA